MHLDNLSGNGETEPRAALGARVRAVDLAELFEDVLALLPMLDVLLRTGVRAVLAVPLLHQAEVLGVLVVRRNQPGTFSQEIIRLVEAFEGAALLRSAT